MPFSPYRVIVSTMLVAILIVASIIVRGAGAAGSETLVGRQEVPAVDTHAMGTASITIAADRSVTGAIETTGIAGTMAHIHQGSVGPNGPVVVTLQPARPNRWEVPANTRLTEGQFMAHKSGELRAQLMP